MSAKRRVPPVAGGVAKKKSPSAKSPRGSALDRVRGLRAFGAKISNRMRAFPETIRASRLAVDRASSSRNDLRRRLRGTSRDRWPRGQRVGVDDDGRDGTDLRGRLAPRGDAARAARGTSTRETRRERDLRDVIDARESTGVGSRAHPKGGDRRVNELLRSLSLERYRDVFSAEEIDMDALRAMRDVDFEKLGVPYGPKVKIIANLRANRRG